MKQINPGQHAIIREKQPFHSVDNSDARKIISYLPHQLYALDRRTRPSDDAIVADAGSWMAQRRWACTLCMGGMYLVVCRRFGRVMPALESPWEITFSF